MPPKRHSRDDLEAMKRADIQKIGKELGLKANLKTETLIDQILDARKPDEVPSPPSSPQSRKSSRVTSTAGARGRTRSSATVVIHDEEEEEEEAEEPEEDVVPKAESEEPPARRTRKAKDTQLRLGVGRPTAAGGSGARAVTKSVSVSKGKGRGKNSRGTKTIQPTIQEEEEEEEQGASSPEAGPSGTSHVEEPHPGMHATPIHSPIATIPSTEPTTLEQEVNAIKSLIAQQSADITNLKKRVDVLDVENEKLRKQAALVSRLESELREIKANVVASAVRAPNGSSKPPALGLGRPTGHTRISPPTTAFPTVSSSTMDPSVPPGHPGIAPSALGKRSRDSTVSEIEGVIDQGAETRFTDEELANQAIRHGKKRAKLSSGDEPEGGQSSMTADMTQDQSDVDAEMMALLQDPSLGKMPAFTVFTGPDETSFDGPPQQHLPHIYAPSPGGGPGHTPVGNGPMTATAFAVENQPPHFSFGYQSTPGPRMPSGFQYMEEPQSPSPAPMQMPNAGMAQSGGGYGQRRELFNPYGMAPRGTSAQPQPGGSGSGAGSGGINPALLLRPDSGTPKRDAGPTSTEIGVGMGMAPSDLATGTPAAMRKTMYGTEVDADTRFGDFGVEGVATGFWAGGRY